MDRPGVRQVPEGSGEQGKMEKTGCEIICGAPTTLAVEGWMMMMVEDESMYSCVVTYSGLREGIFDGAGFSGFLSFCSCGTSPWEAF